MFLDLKIESHRRECRPKEDAFQEETQEIRDIQARQRLPTLFNCTLYALFNRQQSKARGSQLAPCNSTFQICRRKGRAYIVSRFIRLLKKRAAGLTLKATSCWKALTVSAAVTLTVPRRYLRRNQPFREALSFFLVAPRVIYVEDKRGGFLSCMPSRPPRIPRRGTKTRRRNTRASEAHEAQRQVHVPWLRREAGASMSWTRANGIACVCVFAP